MCIILYLNQKSELIKILNYSLSCLVSVHSGIFTAVLIDSGIIVHDIDFGKVMTLTHLEIVRVVSRRYLNNTCSEFHIYIVILNNRDCLIDKRKPYLSAVKIGISLILGINCNRCIAEHGLRSCGCES